MRQRFLTPVAWLAGLLALLCLARPGGAAEFTSAGFDALFAQDKDLSAIRAMRSPNECPECVVLDRALELRLPRLDHLLQRAGGLPFAAAHLLSSVVIGRESTGVGYNVEATLDLAAALLTFANSEDAPAADRCKLLWATFLLVRSQSRDLLWHEQSSSIALLILAQATEMLEQLNELLPPLLARVVAGGMPVALQNLWESGHLADCYINLFSEVATLLSFASQHEPDSWRQDLELQLAAVEPHVSHLVALSVFSLSPKRATQYFGLQVYEDFDTADDEDRLYLELVAGAIPLALEMNAISSDAIESFKSYAGAAATGSVSPLTAALDAFAARVAPYVAAGHAACDARPPSIKDLCFEQVQRAISLCAILRRNAFATALSPAEFALQVDCIAAHSARLMR